MKVYIDFETRSKADLKKVGAYKYAEDPSTEILCAAFQTEDMVSAVSQDKWMLSLHQHAESDCTFVAHNAAFEMVIWNEILVKRNGFPPIPNERWSCTMAKCYASGYPGSLDGAAEALGLGITKDKEGHKVMMKMSRPRKPTKKDPDSIWHYNDEDFEILKRYNRIDVEVEKLIDEALPDLSAKEKRIWNLCLKINQRGIPVDLELASAASTLWAEHTEVLNKRMAEISNGAISTGKQVKAIATWLTENGAETNSVAAEAVENLLAGELPDNCRELLEVRQQAASSSVAKYDTFLMATGHDDRLRGAFQYHGAHTARWAGRIIQPQNLYVPMDGLNMAELIRVIKLQDYEAVNWFYEPFEEVLPSAIRGCISAPEGKTFYVADWNAIEPRVLAWITGETKLIKAFENNELLYEPMATKIFEREITKEDKAERFIGKSAVLGCGYSMGGTRFAAQYNVDQELADKAVSTYRKTYPNIVAFWYQLEDKVRDALNFGENLQFGKLQLDGRDPNIFKIRLPSGRCICYPGMEIGLDGSIEYKTYKLKKFIDTYTYGGKLTENIVQAIARDLLAEALVRLDASGYDLFLHVHDEAGAEVPVEQDSLAEFCSIMEQIPKWASGLPVRVEGWEGTRYDK